MKILTHTRDRKGLVRDNVPDWQTQIDAIWSLLATQPALKAAVEANPVYQQVKAVKAKFPKV